MFRTAICLTMMMLGAPLVAAAEDYKQGALDITHVWARPTAGNSTMGAAYFTVKNTGGEDDTLKSLSTPAAKMADVHQVTTDDKGVMKMRAVEGGLKIPAGGSVELKPAGYHVMMMGLTQKLEAGKTVPLTLSFAKAGDVTVNVQIEAKPAAGNAMHGMDHQNMQGMQGMDHMHH
jgi:copper(I)-binding protein